MAPTDLEAAPGNEEIADLIRSIESDNGKVLCVYHDPYGGHLLLMAALPIEMVDATPYQRNLSETHVRRL